MTKQTNYDILKSETVFRIANASGVIQNKYWYDDLGQLVREDNRATGRTYVFDYDNAGNIQYRKTYAFTTAGTATSVSTTLYSTDNYTYGNANWGDLLTSYKPADSNTAVTISYDDIGNPLSYYNGYTFTWAKGRQLASATNGTNTLSFTYNADGIRTSKTVNGVKHTYLLSGSTIMAEYWQQSGVQHVLIYLYDNTNSPVGMMYRTNAYAADAYDYFLLEKNLQGDIVAVYNSSGTKLLSYTYDAWGNCTVTGSTTTGAQYNPFRYRGYYYDSELGLYYLNARYYDSNIGRFINADSNILTSGTDVKGHNLFAYCFNNPVNLIDPTGEWPEWDTLVQGALLVTIGALTVAAVAATGGTCLPAVAAMYAAVATAGTVTAVVGGAEVVESFTGTNHVRDFTGEQLYDTLKFGSLAVASMGSSVITYGQSASVCFIAGTLVATEKGNVPIEDIQLGDLVWATNEKTGETALKEVVQLFRNETKEWVHVTVDGEKITCTPTHPFYVPQKGWTSAIDLRKGDILVMLNGEYIIVEQIQYELLESPEIIYNFEVEDFHTYHVGEKTVLVHNRGCGKNNLPNEGPANSTSIRYGDNGKVYSAATYGPDGKITARIDFQGAKHYVDSVGEKILPHVHPYANNNGYLRELRAITLNDYIQSLKG